MADRKKTEWIGKQDFAGSKLVLRYIQICFSIYLYYMCVFVWV